jgi:hypothetical protein
VFGAARQIASLTLRGRPSPDSAEIHRVATMTVRTPRPVPLQIDGGAVRLKKKVRRSSDGIVYVFTVVAQGVTVLVPRAYNGDLFSHGALVGAEVTEPIPGHGHAIAFDPSDNGHQPGGRVLRVTDVGTDSFTATRLRDGQVMTVLLNPATELQNGTGTAQAVHDVLGALAPGTIVKVKGKKDRQGTVIQARRITLRDNG